MNILKKLFGGNQSPTKPSPREIVYDFADVLGQLRLPILDAKLLPHPKADIYTAFQIYMAQLEAMAPHLPNSREELERVKPLYLMISDFQEIDPEDRELVSEVNASQRFERFRSPRSADDLREACRLDPDGFKIYTEIENKYIKRASEELGIA